LDLILLVIVLSVVGLIVWMLTTYIPMPPYWATVINTLALVAILLYLLTRLVPFPNVLR
jgi:hypothetical protein